MISDASLLFKAELCRAIKLSGSLNDIKCRPPKSTKIDQVLKQIGVYDLLDHKSKVTPNHPDVINWRFANGSEVIGEKYNEILGHYDGVIPESIASGLYLGITEAMTNCHHHAYIEKRNDGMDLVEIDKNWWMFSQEKDGYLYVVFVDLGVGIPITLPIKKPSWWGRIQKKFKFKPSDGDIISEAINESRSRTGKTYRGKGLKQLVEVIESINGARLFIMSNKGVYSYNNGHAAVFNYRGSILGTLVSWSVPVSNEETNDV